MTMRLVLAGIGLVLLITAPADACSCLPRTPTQMLEQADVVFVGEVLSVDQKGDHQRVYTFRADRKYKGVEQRTVKIISAQDTAACGILGEKGDRMFVYASGKEGTFTTSLCMRTAPLAGAAEDLKELGEGEPVE